MHPYMTKHKAIRALYELSHRYFDTEAESGTKYHEFCEDMALCEEWDGESTTDEFLPPSIWEIFAAAGIKPDDLIAALQMNHLITDDLIQESYD